MKIDKKCPICNKEAEVLGKDPLARIIAYDCDRCGSFQITEDALSSLDERELFKIAAYLRERVLAQQQEITIVSLRKDISSIEGAVVGIDDILAAFPKTVSERLDRSLINLHKLSSYPGKQIPLALSNDYPIFFAENKEASSFFIEALGGCRFY